MAFRRAAKYEELLDSLPWFENVGNVSDSSVSAVRDWKEASIYICDQIVWLNFRNAISNRFRRLWLDAYPRNENAKHFDQIEKLVKKVMQRKAIKEIDTHLTPAQKGKRPSSSFLYHVRWDLNFAGFEFVCQDDLPSLFFLSALLPWYARGHFPCGWRGTMIKADWVGASPADLPNGRLRVL